MKKYWPAILISACAFLFFMPSLKLFFAADDFFYTSFTDIGQAVFFHPGLYHYSPVFWFFMFLMRLSSGNNPWFYHFGAVVLHLVNIFLVYSAAHLLLKNHLKAFFITVLFAFFFAHYETVYWVTGTDTSLLAVFYLTGLISYVKFTGKREPFFMNLYSLFALLAILTHEYALSLPVATLSYEIIMIRKKRIVKALGYQMPAVLLISVIFLLKAIFSRAAFTAAAFSPWRFLASIVKSFDYLLLPLPQLLDRLPKAGLVLLFLLLCLFYSRKRGERIVMWLLLWLSFTVLLFSATSLPQARYFYLSSVPALMLIVHVLNIQTRRKFIYPKLFFLVLLSLSGIMFLKKQESYWFISSQIVNNTLSAVRQIDQSNGHPEEMLFLNLPDSVNGPPWNVYVFRGGLEGPLKSFGIYEGKISYGRTVIPEGITREDDLYTWEKIGEYMSSGTPVFNYDREMLTVRYLNNETKEDN